MSRSMIHDPLWLLQRGIATAFVCLDRSPRRSAAPPASPSRRPPRHWRAALQTADERPVNQASRSLLAGVCVGAKPIAGLCPAPRQRTTSFGIPVPFRINGRSCLQRREKASTLHREQDALSAPIRFSPNLRLIVGNKERRGASLDHRAVFVPGQAGLQRTVLGTTALTLTVGRRGGRTVR
jgi:hypothetical protein